MDNFSNYLGMSFGQVSPLLMSAGVKEKYLHFTVNLPDNFAHSLFGFEKSLSEDSGSMDMSVSSSRTGKYNLGSVFQHPGITGYTLQRDEWKRLQEFADEWSNENSLSRLPEFIILEFDAPASGDAVPVPSVFFGIESLPNEKDISERLNSFIYSVEKVSGTKAGLPFIKLLEDTTRKLTCSYPVFQVGLMLSRITSPIKVCIKGFNKEKLIEHIPGLLSGNLMEELTRITARYGVYFDELVLALDMHDNEIKRAGIECYFRNKKQPPGEIRWEEVLNLLKKDGLCISDLSSPILSFPRKIMMYRFSEDLPEYYAQGLHHIKIVTDGIRTTSKFYFWAGFHWKN